MREGATYAELLTLIVCTRGRIEPLPRLVHSLRLQTSRAFEIVLVDQNPPGYLDDVLAEFPQDVALKHVHCIPGLSRARNLGLAHAAGTIVAFPDDDCWYPPDVIDRVFDHFRAQPNLSILTGPTHDEAGRDSNGAFLRRRQTVTRANVWWAGNSNCIFARREVFARIGMFNEELGVGSGTQYGSGEETDLLLRAIAAGVMVEFIDTLYTHHPQVVSRMDASTVSRTQSYACGNGRILRLNGYPMHYVLYRSFKNTVAALLALLRLDWRFAWFKQVWIVGTWKGYLARRRP